MKKFLAVIAVVISVVAFNSSWQHATENAYKRELYRINRNYIYGEQQLSYSALVKGKFKWVRVRPKHKVARVLFVQRLAKLHSEFGF